MARQPSNLRALKQNRRNFGTIVADPPWSYRDSASAGKRGSVHKYRCLPLEQIQLILDRAVGMFAAPDAHFYLWCTNAFIGDAVRMIPMVGFMHSGYDSRFQRFEHRTLRTWVKPGIGMGSWYRNNTEHCLFAVRGEAPAGSHSIPTALHAPRGKHSEKPEQFYQDVERMSPGPYLELFARKERPGWVCLGDELGVEL